MTTVGLNACRFTGILVMLAAVACGGDKSVDPSVPTGIVANSSTSLTAAAGSAISPLPSVLVTDQNGSPMPGVTVNFEVLSGGGSVTGASVTTGTSGIATVGSWTLGTAAGSNSLRASSGSLAPVIFTATATVAAPPSPCAVLTPHSLGTTSDGALATSDCQLSDGTFVDFFSTTLGANAYLFRQSAQFDTYLYLATPDGAVVAEVDDESVTSTNSAIKALLPAGSYLLAASSYAPITGAYSISSSTTTNSVNGCELVFVVKNVSTTQSVDAGDCLLTAPPASPVYADRYRIFLRSGQSITVTMTSTAVDAFLDLIRFNDGARVASNDNKDATTKDARISFTAGSSDYYTIFAGTGVASQTGTYILTID